LKQLLAWFTDRELAVTFAENSGIKGTPVAIRNAADAAEFLEQNSFYGIAVNPQGIGHWPQTLDYNDFTEHFRREANLG
jgi:hypothetical protein